MQYNIFHNDFYEEMPGLPWAYRIDVFLGDPPRTVAKLAKAVKEVDIPEAELEMFEVFRAGLVFKIPTRYKNSNSFSVSFNDNKNLSAYRELLKLYRRSYDNREQNVASLVNQRIPSLDDTDRSSSAIRRKYSNLKEEMIFVVYIIDPRKINYRDTQTATGRNYASEEVILGLETNDPEIVAVYTFRDCYVESIDNVDFDYSSEECVEWNARIHFNEISVEYPHQDKIIIPQEETEVRMQELNIPDTTTVEQKYRAKANKTVETENEGKYKETADRAYARAKEEFAKLQTEMAGRRETATTRARSEANEEGQLQNGDWVTARERLEGNRKRAEDVQRQETELILERYDYAETKERYGIDLLSDTDEEIRSKVSAMQTEDLINMNYNRSTFEWSQFADELVSRKRSIREETEETAKSIDIRFDITTRDEGAVDMNDTKSTDKYYDADKRGAAYMDQKAAEIRALQGAISAKENEWTEAAQDQGKKRRQYVESKTIDRAEFMEHLEYNTKRMKQAESKIEESMKSYDAIKENKPRRAQTYEEMPKER